MTHITFKHCVRVVINCIYLPNILQTSPLCNYCKQILLTLLGCFYFLHIMLFMRSVSINSEIRHAIARLLVKRKYDVLTKLPDVMRFYRYCINVYYYYSHWNSIVIRFVFDIILHPFLGS